MKARAARTCGYISSEKSRDPFCISPPPDFSLHHMAIGTDSIIIRSSRIDLHPCGSVPRKVGGWKGINKRGAEEKKEGIIFGGLAAVQSCCQRDTYGYGEAAVWRLRCGCSLDVPWQEPDSEPSGGVWAPRFLFVWLLRVFPGPTGPVRRFWGHLCSLLALVGITNTETS